MNKKIKLFIGYDSKQDISDRLMYSNNAPYQVCKKSVMDHNKEVEIYPLKLSSLQELGLYKRTEDTSATTEFTYSRFLVPFLSDYKGISVFCDSDFLWQCDIAEVLNYIDDSNSVSCVKHEYTPKASTKMDGLKQTVYPRKNWSSLMVFNCEHPDCKNLSLEKVNTETPKYLHRMSWTNDESIGSLPLEFNWLEGEYENKVNPKVIHFTNGGPWHLTWNGDYSEQWLKVFDTV